MCRIHNASKNEKMITYDEMNGKKLKLKQIRKNRSETQWNKNEIHNSKNENLWNLHKSEHTPLNNLSMESLYSVLYNMHVR